MQMNWTSPRVLVGRDISRKLANLYKMHLGLYGSGNGLNVGRVGEHAANAALIDAMWVWAGFLAVLGWSHNVGPTKFI